MLWGAALYNNGSYPLKNPQFGEFYTRRRQPGACRSVPGSHAGPDDATTGMLPFLQPLFRWQLTQPGNVLRIFERGGRAPLEIGNPDPEEEPGRPKNRLSNRGLGTLNRTDPVFIGLQKTRLLDPTLNFIGTNDDAGDYRHRRLHRLPRDLRQRSIAGALGGVREGRQSRLEPDVRRDDPEERVGASDQARR